MNAKARACALLFVAACQLSACHESGGGATGSASVAGSAAVPGSASVAGAATLASGAPASAGASAAALGDRPTVTLASGAMMTMPDGARATEMKDAGKRLPGVVKKAHKFELPSGGPGKRLLLVNEMAMEGMTCQALLDRDLERAEKAQADEDPQKRALREMKGVTTIELAGHRALYAESMNKPDSTSETMMGVATLITCRDADYLVIMVAGDQPAGADETKKMLSAVAESYRKP
jgi:hypothetical protein